VFNRVAQIVHIWPCLKPYYCQTTLVINPIFSGISVTLPNIKKITLSTLWLSKDKGHGHPNLTISSSRYKFSKISNPTMFWNFLLIFGRIVADKIIFYLKKFDCKIERFVRYLGPNLAWNESTFVASVTHDRSKNLRWKYFRIFIMIWQVYHTKFMNGSQCFHGDKLWQNLCKNHKFCVIQRS